MIIISNHLGNPLKETEETFSQVTLSSNQMLQHSEQKVLGVNWNVSSDQIIFNLGEIAELAKSLEPIKRNDQFDRQVL